MRPPRRRGLPVSGRGRLALLLLALVPALAAAEAPTHVIPGVPYVAQDRAPWCAAAAAVMVARHHGRDLELRPFVRTLTVHADGVAWLDLIETLPAHGLRAQAIGATAAELRAVIDAGLPAIAIVRDSPANHAWVVFGHGPAGWRVHDPAHPGARWVAPEAFAARWTGSLVIVHRDPPPAGLPWPAWAAETHRFRAEGWLRRARARPPADALALLDRALAADPGHPAVHAQRAAVLAELERPGEACAAIAQARAYATQGAQTQVVEQVAATLRCPPGPPGVPPGPDPPPPGGR